MKRFTWIIALIVIAGLFLFIFFRYYYVFGEGVKSGELNFLVKKGNVFKTYEGKLIQSGLRSGTTGSVQSYEFEFSVEDKRIAETLMRNSGKVLDLHYKEYHATLPWRGFSKYIVDSIYAMKDASGQRVPGFAPR
jgi:hypothetical protein